MDRTKLNRALFTAARAQVAPGFENNDEAIRLVRAAACGAVTKHIHGDAGMCDDYAQLTDREILHAISYLNKGLAYLNESVKKFSVKTGFATTAQQKMIWFHAIQCAIIYCPLDGFAAVSKSGELVQGEAARVCFKELNDAKKLGGAWRSWLCTKWINPKMHEFLADGEFRYQVRQPTKTYYLNHSELTLAEADYCIKRFREMNNVIFERYAQLANSPAAVAFNN